MKAISVKQPYASMIANGIKTIETRRWNTRYRGDLLIVSSARPDFKDPEMPVSRALAVVTLADCRIMTEDDQRAACCEIYPKAKAWVLTNIRRIKPFYVKGSQGFYDSVEYELSQTNVLQVTRVCRGCGCTDGRACPGGCHWVEADLCSQCV